MTNQRAIHLFVMFSFNYPHDFIQKAWEGWIVKHLESKFSSIYQKYGATAVMSKFYTELDAENQEILINYILENYKG